MENKCICIKDFNWGIITSAKFTKGEFYFYRKSVNGDLILVYDNNRCYAEFKSLSFEACQVYFSDYFRTMEEYRSDIIDKILD